MAKKEKIPEPPADAEPAGNRSSTEAPVSRGGRLKLALIVILAMLIGAGGTFIALNFFGGGGLTAPEAQEAAPQETARAGGEGGSGGQTAAVAPEAEGVSPRHIGLTPFIVKLNDDGGRRYLKLNISVEVDSEALGLEINSKEPIFRDTILVLLSSLSYNDISTPDGKARLRDQVLNRINIQLTTGKIRNINFSEFVVQ